MLSVIMLSVVMLNVMAPFQLSPSRWKTDRRENICSNEGFYFSLLSLSLSLPLSSLPPSLLNSNPICLKFNLFEFSLNDFKVGLR